MPSNATNRTVTGLVNGQEYLFRVAAVNSAGTGPFSGTAAVTPNFVPGAVIVSGYVNGTYGRDGSAVTLTLAGTSNGRPYYTAGSDAVSWTGSVWRYSYSGDTFATNSNDTPLPPNTGWSDPNIVVTGGTTLPAITITSQPSNQTAASGAATFSVTATVTQNATLSYQWQKQESGSGSFTNVGGATSSTLALSGLTNADDNGDVYRVVVSATGGAESVTSSSATLTVSPPVANLFSDVFLSGNTSPRTDAPLFSQTGNTFTFQYRSNSSSSIERFIGIAVTLTGSGTLSMSNGLMEGEYLWALQDYGGGILETGYPHGQPRTAPQTGYNPTYAYPLGALNAGTYLFDPTSTLGTYTISWTGTSMSVLVIGGGDYPLTSGYGNIYDTLQNAEQTRYAGALHSAVTMAASPARIDYRVYKDAAASMNNAVNVNFTLTERAAVTFYASAGMLHYYASQYGDYRPLRASSLNGNSAGWSLEKSGDYVYHPFASTGNYTQTVTLNPGAYRLRLMPDNITYSPPLTSYMTAVPV
jgi:hypothetical protein